RGRVDGLDFRLRVDLVREDAGLRPRVAHSVDPDAVQRHRGQRDRLLLPDGEKLIHLAFAGHGADRLGARDEFIRDAGTRRDNDNELVAGVTDRLDALRDVLDAIDVTN